MGKKAQKQGGNRRKLHVNLNTLNMELFANIKKLF